MFLTPVAQHQLDLAYETDPSLAAAYEDSLDLLRAGARDPLTRARRFQSVNGWLMYVRTPGRATRYAIIWGLTASGEVDVLHLGPWD